MITAEKMCDLFYKNDITTFVGVPDSTTKELSAYLEHTPNKFNYLISANEGNAVAIGAGIALGNGELPCVFLQNSGIGNIINPVVSLTDENVYDIPLIYIIGWRGNAEENDAPQHVKQGKITINLLEVLDIKPFELKKTDSQKAIANTVDSAIKYVKNEKKSAALLIRKGLFERTNVKNINVNNYQLSRNDALKMICDSIDNNSVVVTGTGMISREWYNIFSSYDHNNCLMNVGAMGHTSSLTLGLRLSKYQMPIYCIEGDGSLLMHLGCLPYITKYNKKKFVHIILNNGVHDTVGGQKTAAFDIELCKMADAFNYDYIYCVTKSNELSNILNEIKKLDGNIFLEIRINNKKQIGINRPNYNFSYKSKAISKYMNQEV